MYRKVNKYIVNSKWDQHESELPEIAFLLSVMNPNNPIIVIDDDADDHELFVDACRKLQVPNEIVLIESAKEFLHYLDNAVEPPFLIISDFNLPGTNGLSLRKTILQDPYLRYKTVPYVIWTTGANDIQIREAYENMIQGFFIKPSKFEDLVAMLRTLFDYWKISLHPSKA